MISEYSERCSESADRCDDRVLLRERLCRLSSRELKAVTLRFRDEFTLREVGKRIGPVGPEMARCVIARAVRTMQRPDPLSDKEHEERWGKALKRAKEMR